MKRKLKQKTDTRLLLENRLKELEDELTKTQQKGEEPTKEDKDEIERIKKTMESETKAREQLKENQ